MILPNSNHFVHPLWIGIIKPIQIKTRKSQFLNMFFFNKPILEYVIFGRRPIVQKSKNNNLQSSHLVLFQINS